MSDRNNEEARTTQKHILAMVLSAERKRHETGDTLSTWAIYSAAAGMASGALYLDGLDADLRCSLTVLAAQCYELAGASRMAVRYAEQGLKMALSPTDLGILRQIQNKAMVAA
jgi:hypothetical protein